MNKHLNYSAIVESLAGQQSRLTLQITGRDTQGAFDWCCGNHGLKRVSSLEQIEEPLDHTAKPFQRATNWSWRKLWQILTE